MRHSLKRIGKRTLSIVLTLMMLVSTMVVGMVSANAGNVKNGYIYFELPSNWNSSYNVQYGLYQNGYSYVAAMEKISNTNLYYAKTPDHSSWSNEQIYFIANSSTWKSGSFDGTGCTYYTQKLTQDISENNYYLFKPTSTTSNGKNVPISASSNTSKGNLTNLKQTVNVYTDGASSTTGGNVKITGYYLNTEKTTTSATSSTSSSSTTANFDCVYTSTVKFNATAATGYSFEGWYDSTTSTTALSTDLEYSYTVTSAKTIYARFKESKTTLATPTVTLTNNGVITSDTPVKLTIAAPSGSSYPNGTTFKLYNSSGTAIKTLSLGANSLSYSDTSSITNGSGYYVKAISPDTSTYNDSASSATFSLLRVQLYNITIADDGNSDVTVTGSYTDAYGNQNQTIAEGKSAKVPANGTLKVTADVNASNKEFSKFTYNSTNYTDNPASITVIADGTVTTTVNTVSMQTIKIAVVSYADPSATGTDTLNTNPTVSYTTASKTGTASMTETSDKVYFYISGTWSNAQTYYVYTVSVPSTTTKITIDSKGSELSIDSSKDYYVIYHYGGWKTTSLSESDRYYPITIQADTSVDSGATVSSSVSVTDNKKTLDSDSDYTGYVYKYGTEITLTATPSNTNAYELDRWNDGTADFESPYTVTGEATLTAYFKAKQKYTITLSASNATISSSPSGSTYSGEKVTVTVTPNSGYEVVDVLATTASGSVTVTKNSDGTYSFTMPSAEVTVTANVQARTKCNITVRANDDTLGTVNFSGSTVYIGDTFTVSATPNSDCGFKDFTLAGATQKSSSTTGSVTTATFSADSQNITVTANFYTYIYSIVTSDGTTVDMVQSATDSNLYYSATKLAKGTYFKVKREFGSTTTYCKLLDSSGYIDTHYLQYANPYTTISNWDTNSNVGGENNKQGGIYLNTSDSNYITFDKSTGRVSYSLTSDGKQAANVYVKYGTESYKDSTMNGSALYGTSVAETNSNVTLSESQTYYKVYTATAGSVVKVTTTVNSTYASQYYVHAFVVNGKTYLATEGTGNTYTAEFAVEEGVSTYEVTPIYYVNDCKTVGKYITFYVDSSEMAERGFNWGDTISSYSYAYKSEESTDAYTPDGGYPGQPMLYDEGQGRFYARVPKLMNGKEVTGITINNYKNDKVHGLINTSLTSNDQSYDYNDFKMIYNLGYDIIRFDMKPRNGASTNYDLLGIDSNGNAAKAFSYSSYSSNNGWEDFVDINGNKVDAIGYPVDSSVTKKLYVVSTASHNISGIGEWAVKWFVYNQNNELVTSGLPSDFIPRPNTADNTEQYNAILNGYKGAATEITFENQKTYNSGATNRLDGRWYYAQSESEVTADVKYRTTGDGTTYTTPVADANVAAINGATSVTFEKHGETINVVAKPLSGYVFSQWSIFDNEGNFVRNLSSTLGSAFTTTLDSEIHYVANYVKATTGNLVLSHSKYTGTDAKGGLGYYLIEAQVYNSSDVSIGDLVTGSGTGLNGQSITLSGISSENTGGYILIKLTTTTAGENTFRYWYTNTNEGFEIIDDMDAVRTVNGSTIGEDEDTYGANGTVTYTFKAPVDKLFSGRKQVITEYSFYSDIAPVSKDYKLTYKYTDRFGNDKMYVVKGTHEDSYYTKNGSWAPTDQLIADNAPAIDDLYKDCTWVIANSSKDGTDATLVAKHTGKNYDIDIYNPDETYTHMTLPLNSFVKSSNGKFFAVPSEYNGKAFQYWAVYERLVDADGNVTQGDEVIRHFYSEYTLRVTDNYIIKPVYGTEATDKVYIGHPQYSREQTTDADGNLKTDKLYVDFMVAFMSKDGELIRNDTDGTSYQSGVLIEIGQNKVLEKDENGTVNPDYSGITYDSDETKVKSAVTLDNGKNISYSYNNDSNDKRKVFNYVIPNTAYNNMNRADLFVYFKNSTTNRNYVMKAYYYVIIGSVTVLSEPVYFNLYKIGNSEPNKVTTTS